MPTITIHSSGDISEEGALAVMTGEVVPGGMGLLVR